MSELIPQPHGGALRPPMSKGETRNPHGGSTKASFKRAMREALGESIDITQPTGKTHRREAVETLRARIVEGDMQAWALVLKFLPEVLEPELEAEFLNRCASCGATCPHCGSLDTISQETRDERGLAIAKVLQESGQVPVLDQGVEDAEVVDPVPEQSSE